MQMQMAIIQQPDIGGLMGIAAMTYNTFCDPLYHMQPPQCCLGNSENALITTHQSSKKAF